MKNCLLLDLAVILLLPQFALSFTNKMNRLAFAARLKPTRRMSTTVVRHASTLASSEEKVMQDMIYRVRQINHMPEDIRSSLLDFTVDGIRLGRVRPRIADMLCSVDNQNPVFRIENSDNGKKHLTLTAGAGGSVETRTASVNRIMRKLADQGIVKGWRDEDYPIKKSFDSETIFGMERSSVPLLGAMEYGVHINGFVKEEGDKKEKMWIGRRSADKSKYPGMLDHIVAGGQPVGLSLLENVIKECEEEAGIDEKTTVAGIQAAGAISYECYSPKSEFVTRCVLFCYDLHLPASFKPKPVDGEVEDFFLWDIDQIKASMDPDYPDPIKPNCYPVIIDYLLRRGHVSPDTPGYLDVMRELRSGDCI